MGAAAAAATTAVVAPRGTCPGAFKTMPAFKPSPTILRNVVRFFVSRMPFFFCRAARSSRAISASAAWARASSSFSSASSSSSSSSKSESNVSTTDSSSDSRNDSLPSDSSLSSFSSPHVACPQKAWSSWAACPVNVVSRRPAVARRPRTKTAISTGDDDADDDDDDDDSSSKDMFVAIY